MKRHEKSLGELLGKIADLAKEAERVAGRGQSDGDDAHDHGDGGHEEGAPAEFGCAVKSLPTRLAQRGADNAVRHNPANGLVFGRFAAADGGVPSDPARLAILVAKYWGPQPRRLTVSFMESTPADLRRRIVSHLNAWTRTGCIEFVETGGTGQVRISRGPGGFYSYLGTDVLLIPRNRQTMNLEGFTMNTPDSEFRRVVRHEAGHTLGFPHEHMRRQLVAKLDPRKCYEYFWRTNGWDRAMVDAQVLTPLEERSIRGTPNADEESIMCYQLPGSITRDGRPIRGGSDINRADYEFCGTIYPRRGPGRALGDEGAEAGAEDWPEAEDVREIEEAA